MKQAIFYAIDLLRNCPSVRIFFTVNYSQCASYQDGNIRIDFFFANSFEIQNIATICHEAGHAIDHQRWPWLFKARNWFRWLLLGYFINLFLEWHASRLAYRYLASTGDFSARQLDQIKYFYWKSFKTYL